MRFHNTLFSEKRSFKIFCYKQYDGWLLFNEKDIPLLNESMKPTSMVLPKDSMQNRKVLNIFLPLINVLLMSFSRDILQ